MKNLNKENFWNEVYILFPEAVEHFCKWIDEYKKTVNWDQLFGIKPGAPPRPEAHSDPFFNVGLADRQKDWEKNYRYKFHDLPLEMQIGILERFKREVYGTAASESLEFVLQLEKLRIETMFRELNNRNV